MHDTHAGRLTHAALSFDLALRHTDDVPAREPARRARSGAVEANVARLDLRLEQLAPTARPRS